MRQLKILASTALMSVALTSCGGDKGLSGDVKFEALPKNPLVINADITIGTGEDSIVIKKPWFETRYRFKNNSNQTLVVVTLTYKVSSNKDGVESVNNYSIDPAAFCGDGQYRPYLGIIAKNGGEFTGYDTDGSDPFSRCDESLPLPSTEFEKFIFGGLAAADSPIYSVLVTAEGWFENDSGEITERLIATDLITTR